MALAAGTRIGSNEILGAIGNEGTGNYALSGSGTPVYLAGGRSRNARRLVWIDRAGKVEPASLPVRDYENVLFAPDGNRAVVQIRDNTTDLWIFDVGRGTLTPIGNSPGSCQSPVWTADGTRVIYRGTRAGLRNVFWLPTVPEARNGSRRRPTRVIRRRRCRRTATGSCSTRTAHRKS